MPCSAFFPLRFASAFALCALAFVAPTLRAQTEPPSKTISDKLSAELGKLRTLADAKNYPEALRLIDTLITTAPNPSFDLAVLSQVKAQLHLFNNQYTAAVAPLETTLALIEAHGFFDTRTRLDTLYTLSQLYYQLATESKKPAEQSAYFEKSYSAINRWLALSPAPTAEARLYAASIRYGQATLDPNHIDKPKIAEVRRAAEESLFLELKPKDTAYVLLLASLQIENDLAGMADLLELLVTRRPDSVTYWQQLAGTYYSLAAATRDEAEIQRNNLRALLTLERAQARGLLKSPRENYAVVALYFTLQRFDRAIALLEAGLQSGAIESNRRNWELLASAYQQQRENDPAVATLKKAIARFPDEPAFPFSLGQLYYAINRPEDAYPYLAAASAHKNLERPGQSRLFTAYIAFELQRYEAARQWLEAAAASPDTKPEDLERLRRAVTEKLRERAPAAQPAA